MSLFSIINRMLDEKQQQHNTYVHFKDPQGEQVTYKNTHFSLRPDSVLGRLVTGNHGASDQQSALTPAEIVRGIADGVAGNIGPHIGNPTGRQHFQRVGGGDNHPGFYVQGENLGNIGSPDFMQQVVRNNPDWNFGQTWGQRAALPNPLRAPSTFTQNRKVIDGKPHEWNGTEWVLVPGY